MFKNTPKGFIDHCQGLHGLAPPYSDLWPLSTSACLASMGEGLLPVPGKLLQHKQYVNDFGLFLDGSFGLWVLLNLLDLGILLFSDCYTICYGAIISQSCAGIMHNLLMIKYSDLLCAFCHVLVPPCAILLGWWGLLLSSKLLWTFFSLLISRFQVRGLKRFFLSTTVS